MSSSFAKVYLSKVDGKASALAQVVFLYLSKYADENGICYPSLKTLVTHTNISKKTIIKLIRELHDIDAIRIEKSGYNKIFYRIMHKKYGNHE